MVSLTSNEGIDRDGCAERQAGRARGMAPLLAAAAMQEVLSNQAGQAGRAIVAASALAGTPHGLCMDVSSASVAAPSRRRAPPSEVEVSVIMPTVSWDGAFDPCARRILSLLDAGEACVEFIVVADGHDVPPPAWLDRPGVHVLATPSRQGPAAARNRGAAEAAGRILFFVDADVQLATDSIARLRASFAGDDHVVAVFGAYDDAPAAAGLVSQFRNLLHHHTHVTHAGRAHTFWAGCGAVRAVHFHDVGGFDERYSKPSIEDIELGMRIAAAGGRIDLDPQLQGKHHKRWTLRSMVVTDVMQRAVPWTRLIVSRRRLPATLAIDWSSRISGAIALCTAACFAIALWRPAAIVPAIIGVAALLVIHREFYRLCFRRGGVCLAVTAIALHGLFFAYSTLVFAAVSTHEWLHGLARRGGLCRADRGATTSGPPRPRIPESAA